jgi:hypothetical protein
VIHFCRLHRMESVPMCVESQIDLMLPYFRLREEARKSWDYLVTDSLVYCAEILKRDSDPLLLISEYDHGFHWLELHIRLVSEVEEYLSVIIECLFADRLRAGGEFVISDHRMKRDMPMLVDAPQGVQNPKIIELVGIPTSVWLQRSNNTNSLLGHSESGFRKGNLIVQGVLPVDREANSFGLGLIADLRNQLPSQVIEGRSKTRNKIPSDQSAINIQRRGAHINDILASFRFIVRKNALSMEFVPIFYELAQSIQMNLRPGNLVHYGANW